MLPPGRVGPPRRIRAVLFDLDGTLVDSLRDLAESMNHALAAHGQPPHPVEAYRAMVGAGVHHLVQRALPPSAAHLREAVLSAHLAHYATHAHVHSAPYPGVAELLAALLDRGLSLAVLSNKPHALTRALVAHFFGDTFAHVLGERPQIPRKPDPTSALEIAARLGVPPGACAFVGDTGIDMETAGAAGMWPVGVLWGFRGQEELSAGGAAVLLRHPSELPALLDAG